MTHSIIKCNVIVQAELIYIYEKYQIPAAGQCTRPFSDETGPPLRNAKDNGVLIIEIYEVILNKPCNFVALLAKAF